MINKRSKIAILAAVVSLVSSAAYLWQADFRPRQPAAPAGPLEKISLGINAGKLSGLIFIAQDQGYFRENGLEAELRIYEAGRDAVKDLLAGKLDIACCAEFVLVNEIFKGQDNLRILGSICLAEINELIAGKDKGIDSPSDLRGKKIGLPLKTVAEYAIGRFLIFAGVSINDVTLVNLGPAELEEALARGEVDAVMAFDPWMAPIKARLGDQAVSWPGQTGHESFWAVVALAGGIQQRPQVMVKLLQALAQAEKFLANQPEKGRTMIAQWYEAPATLRDGNERAHYELALDQNLLLTMEDEARWLIQNRLTDRTQVPNYLDYLYPEALMRVNPKAVRMIIPGKVPPK